MPNYFAGIDPSLAGSSAVIINENGKIIKQVLITTYCECYINIEQRLIDILNQLKFVSRVFGLKYIYIEGLSFTSRSTSLFERQGLFYLLTTYFFENELDYTIVSPTELKKWTTTDGHADKNMMMKIAKCRWGINFQNDNICDAYCLARMALEEYQNEK